MRHITILYIQAAKWRLHRRSCELVASDAEWRLHFCTWYTRTLHQLKRVRMTADRGTTSRIARTLTAESDNKRRGSRSHNINIAHIPIF